MWKDLYFLEYVDRDLPEVVAALSEPNSRIFQSATDHAVTATELFRDRLHVQVAGFDIGREVEIEVGQAEDRGYATYLPIAWHAANQAALFPLMKGELEIEPLSHSPDRPLTQLSIMCRYRPPAGLLGGLGDALLGHRIAEAAVRNFVMDLAARLAPTDVRPLRAPEVEASTIPRPS
jgi:hypothetical protein